MPLANPYTKLGSSTANTVATTSITTLADIPKGALIIVRAGCSACPSSDFGTVTDNSGVGNTYTQNAAGNGGSTTAAATYSGFAQGFMPAGTIISLAWTATPAANQAMDAIFVTNGVSGTPYDVSHIGASVTTGTAAASGTVTPNANEGPGALILRSTIISKDATGTITPQAGWTEDTDIVGIETQTSFQIGNGTFSGAGTLSAAADWICMASIYRLTDATAYLPINSPKSGGRVIRATMVPAVYRSRQK